MFPIHRPRRLRKNHGLRKMVRETSLTPQDFIYPLFIVPGKGVKNPIPSMPDCFQESIDRAIETAKEVFSLGIPAIILFGIPSYKDEKGTSAYDDNGVIQQALRAIKDAVPDLILITDVCLCEYTSHGHCGIVKNGNIDNDATLEILALEAISHAKAGADIVAPSDMMDGRVGKIRKALDEEGYCDVIILSYAAKYSSAFYGPFREAAQSAPAFGDRRSYQMDPANRREALREVSLDIEEGADIVMVKPALAYLDIISDIKMNFTVPVAAYNVSGEYSMIKAAAQMGWLNEEATFLEVLTSIKRAGADIILTYYAKKAAQLLQS